MGERRIINGYIYEKAADGSIVPVGPAQPSAVGQAIGGNPMVPLNMQGQGLQNVRTQQQINQANQTQPLQVTNQQLGNTKTAQDIAQDKLKIQMELQKSFRSD